MAVKRNRVVKLAHAINLLWTILKGFSMKDEVRRYYEKRASTYEDLDSPDSIISAVRAIGIHDHMRIMGIKQKDRVLDMGCGPGRFLKPFSGSAMAVGVDFTLDMLLQAKKTGTHLIRADAEHLPIKDDVFDVVHSAGLLGVYRSGQICHEMGRVAREGGHVYVSFPAAESVSGVVARMFMKLGWNPTLLDFWYTKKDVERMMPQSLTVTAVHRLGFEPPFQRLYKNIRSRRLVKAFIFIERRLRDRPLFRYFGSRYLVAAKK